MDREKQETKRWRRSGNTDSKSIEKHVLEDNTGEEYEDLELKWIKLESRPKKH